MPPPPLHLRPVTPADLPSLFRFQLDPESNRLAVTNARDAAAFNAQWDRIFADPAVIARAIILGSGDEPGPGLLVGSISLFQMDGLDSIGYWIARELANGTPGWGRGIASRALDLFLQEVPTRPLHAQAARTNTPSIRVLQRNGFTITGHRHAPATDRYPACEVTTLILR